MTALSSPDTFGVIILTQGRRPTELRAAIDSVLAQQDVVTDIVVVGNGWVPVGLPAGVRAVALTENLGIPAGRNRGVPHVAGDFLFFLDDDALIPSPTFLRDARRRFDADPKVGMLQPRVHDPESSADPRRWVPRIRKGNPARPSVSHTVWEGAIVIPRTVFEATGGWAEPFFYAHEGIELAWRVWDQGLYPWYAGDLVAHHPAINPTRHSYYYRLNARNRVWLAKRNLPLIMIPLYVGSWTAVHVIRSRRNLASLSPWFGGWVAGWREPAGPRRSIRWVTVWRMTRSGRPPLI